MLEERRASQSWRRSLIGAALLLASVTVLVVSFKTTKAWPQLTSVVSIVVAPAALFLAAKSIL